MYLQSKYLNFNFCLQKIDYDLHQLMILIDERDDDEFLE
jgi:hypothetical protein